MVYINSAPMLFNIIHVNAFICCMLQATDSMKMSMTQAMMERNSAVSHATKMKKELGLCEREREQERSRLKTELESVRGRLALAEKDLVETKEGCIHLTDTVQSLEREVRYTHLKFQIH